MGSPVTERGRYDVEGPVHTVTIADDFYMGKYEVTQAQWLALMEAWPTPEVQPSETYGLGGNYPAYYISWVQVQAFIGALNAYIAESGQGPLIVRLPSEAEWEYACRAGAQTRFFFGDSLDCDDNLQNCSAGTLPGLRGDYMWYGGNNEPDMTKEVGQKLPNPFGLYDMHGNVAELCEDDYWFEGYTKIGRAHV